MMKRMILLVLCVSALTSCVTGGIGIDSSGKVRGNIGVSTGGPLNGNINLDSDGDVSGGVGIGF